MQPWMQIYDPLGNLWLSSLIAALPIFFFFIALAVLRYPRTTLILILAFAVLPMPSGIFLKKSILFGFSFGVCAALHRIDIKRIDRFAVPVGGAECVAEVVVDLRLSGAEAERLYEVGDGFSWAAGLGERGPESVVRFGVSGLEAERLLVVRNGCAGLA